MKQETLVFQYNNPEQEAEFCASHTLFHLHASKVEMESFPPLNGPVLPIISETWELWFVESPVVLTSHCLK